jgi:hypothetical protein
VIIHVRVVVRVGDTVTAFCTSERYKNVQLEHTNLGHECVLGSDEILFISYSLS